MQNNKQNPNNPVVDEILTKVDTFIDPARDSNGAELISCAKKLGEYLAQNVRMTTSQVRNLFTAAKRINYDSNNGPYEVNLLRAKFAYNAGRFSQVKDFQIIADKMLSHINNKGNFGRFIDFFEAVVAYHKAFGGKE